MRELMTLVGAQVGDTLDGHCSHSSRVLSNECFIVFVIRDLVALVRARAEASDSKKTIKVTAGDILACSRSCAVRADIPAAVLSGSDMWQLSADYLFVSGPCPCSRTSSYTVSE